MRLGDVYKHKKYNSFIRIDSFATHINRLSYKDSNMVIVVNQLQVIDGDISTCPSFNRYGTQKEIERDYKLFISSELPPNEFMEEIDKLKSILEGEE